MGKERNKFNKEQEGLRVRKGDKGWIRSYEGGKGGGKKSYKEWKYN